jgi:hypothetical protein
MKRPRLRKWAKWACTLAAVLAVGLAVSTRFYSLSLEVPVNGGSDSLFVSACTGRLWCGDRQLSRDGPRFDCGEDVIPLHVGEVVRHQIGDTVRRDPEGVWSHVADAFDVLGDELTSRFLDRRHAPSLPTTARRPDMTRPRDTEGGRGASVPDGVVEATEEWPSPVNTLGRHGSDAPTG